MNYEQDQCVVCRIRGDCNSGESKMQTICSVCIEGEMENHVGMNPLFKNSILQVCMKHTSDGTCVCCKKERMLCFDLGLCSVHESKKNKQVYNVFLEDKDFGEMEFGVFDDSSIMVQQLVKATKRRISEKLYTIAYAAEYEDKSKNSPISAEFPTSHVVELVSGCCIIQTYYGEIGKDNRKKYNCIRIQRVTMNCAF